MSDNNLDFFGETIYKYTRAEAIADGVLIDVSKTAREAGFKIPVAVTSALWEQCIEWSDTDSKQAYQDSEGRLWDVLKMLFIAIKRNPNNGSELLYEVLVIKRDGKSKKPELTQLKSVVGGGDDGNPVITIMLPQED